MPGWQTVNITAKRSADLFIGRRSSGRLSGAPPEHKALADPQAEARRRKREARLAASKNGSPARPLKRTKSQKPPASARKVSPPKTTKMSDPDGLNDPQSDDGDDKTTLEGVEDTHNFKVLYEEVLQEHNELTQKCEDANNKMKQLSDKTKQQKVNIKDLMASNKDLRKNYDDLEKEYKDLQDNDVAVDQDVKDLEKKLLEEGQKLRPSCPKLTTHRKH